MSDPSDDGGLIIALIAFGLILVIVLWVVLT